MASEKLQRRLVVLKRLLNSSIIRCELPEASHLKWRIQIENFGGLTRYSLMRKQFGNTEIRRIRCQVGGVKRRNKPTRSKDRKNTTFWISQNFNSSNFLTDCSKFVQNKDSQIKNEIQFHKVSLQTLEYKAFKIEKGTNQNWPVDAEMLKVNVEKVEASWSFLQKFDQNSVKIGALPRNSKLSKWLLASFLWFSRFKTYKPVQLIPQNSKLFFAASFYWCVCGEAPLVHFRRVFW